MTTVKLMLVAFIGLIATGCASGPQISTSPGFNSKVSCVCASRDIKTGEEFTHACLGNQFMELTSYTPRTAASKESLFERRAGRDIKAGEFILLDDIMEADRIKWTQDDEKRHQQELQLFPGYVSYYLCFFDVKKGEPFLTRYAVRRQEPRNQTSVKIPVDGITTLKQVRGMKARNDIPKGKIIARSDLEPI